MAEWWKYDKLDLTSMVNILMTELNRFTIFDGEGPQEMFDRMMVIVGKLEDWVVMSYMIALR
jgi:hypothetical protein